MILLNLFYRKKRPSVEAPLYIHPCTIEEQLSYDPEVETRNRKPLLQPSELGATWELRFGPKNQCRVFYETNYDANEVYILTIGIKIGNQLFIGKEESEP